MGRKVLGKITSSTAGPRGPDAEMQVALPENWIAEGATIEIELPRNLLCAGCGGGGCDGCERSGAVSLRGRKEPAEIVEVTLPRRRGVDSPASSRVVVRIPQRGGLPPKGTELPRGNLLLAVQTGSAPPRGVIRLPGPSIPPPPPEVAPVIIPVAPALRPVQVRVAIVALAVALLIAWLAARAWR